MSEERLLLLGCGILKKEVQFLIEKNHWPMATSLMASALHTDFDKLERGLRGSLAKHHAEKTVVFYGCCHPRMEQILDEAGTVRTEGQNCVEMVLGRERFTEELLAGALFLFEDWVLHWERVATLTFGPNRAIMREILHGDRTFLLAIRTPCSTDFTEQAEYVSRETGLPLRWIDVSLDHLEAVLRDAIERRLEKRA